MDLPVVEGAEEHEVVQRGGATVEPVAQVMAVEDARLAGEDGSLDGVLQLADVSRPGMAGQHVHCRGRDAADALAVRARIPGEEMLGEQEDVGAPFA